MLAAHAPLRSLERESDTSLTLLSYKMNGMQTNAQSRIISLANPTFKKTKIIYCIQLAYCQRIRVCEGDDRRRAESVSWL